MVTATLTTWASELEIWTERGQVAEAAPARRATERALATMLIDGLACRAVAEETRKEYEVERTLLRCIYLMFPILGILDSRSRIWAQISHTGGIATSRR